MAASSEAKQEPTEKGGKLKWAIIAAAGLLVVGGGGGAAAYFLGLLGGKPAAAVPAPATDAHGANASGGEPAAHGGQGGKPGPQLSFVELPELLVNLRSAGKRMRFLKLKVALEVKDERTAESVKTLTPRIMDSFQLHLRALDAEEIEGSHGMQSLKEELLARINQAVTPSRIEDVLFKEMLVQ